MATYLDYIDKIQSLSTNQGYYRNRKVYKVKDKLVSFWQKETGEYLNGLQFTTEGDFMWTCSEPEQFYNNYCDNKDLEFIQYSMRFYGQPKIEKPKELSNIKEVFSVDYIPKKCKCPVYIKDNDVWIKHRDYFSSSMKTSIEDEGTPLEYRSKKYLGKDRSSKFIYPDNWGEIICRNEAWICIKNLLHRLRIGDSELKLIQQILRHQEKVCGFLEYELQDSDMERMYEQLISKLIDYEKLK